MKTLEQLNQAVLRAKADVASAEAELENLQAENMRLQDAVTANFDKQTEVRLRKQDADYAIYVAKRGMRLARSNAVIAGFDGMSREGFIAGLRVVVRSKFPIVDSLVRTLERGASEQGASEEEMSRWHDAECYRLRDLSAPMQERVRMVLDKCCPRHPDSGRYLPPYEVVED